MRALVILHPQFEEIEAVTPMDLLSRAGVEVIIASTSSERAVTGRSGITLLADAELSDVAEDLFDAIILPGGPGIQAIRNDALICGLLQQHHTSGKWIACICAAPLLLQDAGLLQEYTRYTSHPSVEDELCGELQVTEVVTDGTLLTARGASSSLPFSLQLIKKICDPETANRIAVSICYENGTQPTVIE
jgi:4-methyl-5(b-hydroxyethyl)-thiazole monophosphate biosynthesis